MQVLLEYFIDLVIQWKKKKRCMTARDSLDEHPVMANNYIFSKKTQQYAIVCDTSYSFSRCGMDWSTLQNVGIALFGNLFFLWQKY